MTKQENIDELEVGYDIPAAIGMAYEDIQTPCLILDLDALERNVKKMGDYARAHNMRHRAHGKMHKSVDVLKLQMEQGGAIGVCCQKVSEAEVFARAGIKDILVSNQVRDPAKIDRLARMPKSAAAASSSASTTWRTSPTSRRRRRSTAPTLDVFVEIDCGAGRCGVTTTEPSSRSPRPSPPRPACSFLGIQAYQGAMQHLDNYEDRKAKLDAAIAQVKDAVEALKTEGLEPELVSGGGTGSYYFESQLRRLQRAPVRQLRLHGRRLRPHPRQGRQAHRPGRVGERALHPDQRHEPRQAATRRSATPASRRSRSTRGLPFVYGRDDVKYIKCSDEHGVIEDKGGVLKINEKLKLVPGHCDPTCNVHDWYVGVRNGKVESLWPVSARGKAY